MKFIEAEKRSYVWLTKEEVQYIAYHGIRMIQLHPERPTTVRLMRAIDNLCGSQDWWGADLGVFVDSANDLDYDLPQLKGKDFVRGKTFEKYKGLNLEERHHLRIWKHAKWIREVAAELNYNFEMVEKFEMFGFYAIPKVPKIADDKIKALIAKNREAENSKRAKSREKKAALEAEAKQEEGEFAANSSPSGLMERNAELNAQIKMLKQTHAQNIANMQTRLDAEVERRFAAEAELRKYRPALKLVA